MQDYICCFVDVLGAKAQMEEEGFAEGLANLLEMIENNKPCRPLIKECSDEIKKHHPHFANKSYEEIEEILTLMAPELQFSGSEKRVFSDSIVIINQVMESNFRAAFFEVVSMASILHLVAINTVRCLVRGGITYGKLHVGEKLILGPALIQAQIIESQEAIYPRIVLDEVVVQKFKDSSWLIKPPVTQDQMDGRMYVKPVTFDKETDTCGLYSSMVKNFAVMTEKAKNQSNPTVMQKYTWFANEINKGFEELGAQEKLCVA